MSARLLALAAGAVLVMGLYGPTVASAGSAFDAFMRGDYPAALRDARAAAAAGDPEGAFLLGTMYSHGSGVRRDALRALKLFERAAGQGHADAAMVAAHMLRFGGEGVTADPARAARYLRQAAVSGNAFAAYLLGQMYMHGQGVSRDDEAARHLLEEASGSVPAARYELALLLADGRGGPSNLSQAYAMFHDLSCEGYPGASQNVRALATLMGELSQPLPPDCR